MLLRPGIERDRLADTQIAITIVVVVVVVVVVIVIVVVVVVVVVVVIMIIITTIIMKHQWCEPSALLANYTMGCEKLFAHVIMT